MLQDATHAVTAATRNVNSQNTNRKRESGGIGYRFFRSVSLPFRSRSGPVSLISGTRK
jgi:hypothetical protein